MTPQPYYSDALVTLYHGRAEEITDWLAADVLVVDPPYGINAHHNHSHTIEGDTDTTVRDTILRMWGPDKPALCFGRHDIPRPAGTLTRRVWDKMQGAGKGNLTFPFGQGDEEVYVLGTWPPVVPGGRRRDGGTPARWGSVITGIPGYNSQSRDRPDHPTPKPPALMVHLLETCPPGVAADPCAGSGPLLLAAQITGRRAIGVELEERYCEITATRLSAGLPFAASREGGDR